MYNVYSVCKDLQIVARTRAHGSNLRELPAMLDLLQGSEAAVTDLRQPSI